MRVLFDQGTPVPLRELLAQHEVSTAYEQGWATFKNGELLSAAETAGFGVLVTTDQSLKYQQNVQSRRIAIVVLSVASWPRIKDAVAAVADAIDKALPGKFTEVEIP